MRLGELLVAGGEDVSTFSTPAPLTDGIKLMVVGGVILIGLLVDAMAVTFRSAARQRGCRSSPCIRSRPVSPTAGRAGCGSCWPPPAICCSCWRRAGTGSPSGAVSSAGLRGPGAVWPKGCPVRAAGPPRADRAADRRAGARHRPGGAPRPARAGQRSARRQRPGERQGQRRRHDLRGESAGLVAEQPQPAGEPGGDDVPQQHREPAEPLSPDPGPGRVQRQRVAFLHPAADGRARPAPQPAGLGGDISVAEVRTNISASRSYQQTYLPLPTRRARSVSTAAGGSSPRAAPWSATTGRRRAARSTRSAAWSSSPRHSSSRPRVRRPRSCSVSTPSSPARCRRWSPRPRRKSRRARPTPTNRP